MRPHNESPIPVSPGVAGGMSHPANQAQIDGPEWGASVVMLGGREGITCNLRTDYPGRIGASPATRPGAALIEENAMSAEAYANYHGRVTIQISDYRNTATISLDGLEPFGPVQIEILDGTDYLPELPRQPRAPD